MIIGESQILGQIKEAFEVALTHKSTGIILNKVDEESDFCRQTCADGNENFRDGGVGELCGSRIGQKDFLGLKLRRPCCWWEQGKWPS